MTIQTGLIIVLLALILVSIGCVGALVFLRRRRNAKRNPLLPQHHNDTLGIRRSHHRRTSSVSVASSDGAKDLPKGSIFAGDDEKRALYEEANKPNPKNLPSIHITFPEEVDEAGKRKSGVVVVLHVGENGVTGLEPVKDEDQSPPPYSERFVSLDLERIGGLKEKTLREIP